MDSNQLKDNTKENIFRTISKFLIFISYRFFSYRSAIKAANLIKNDVKKNQRKDLIEYMA